MRRRGLVVSATALVAGSTLVSLTPSPAGAALHKRKALATHVLPCEDGSGKVARVWFPHEPDEGERPKSWAVDNPCKKQWVIIDAPGESVTDPYGDTLSVAPRTSFHTSSQWIIPDNERHLGVYLDNKPFDGREDCPLGHSLLKVGPRDHGRFRLIRHCDLPDDWDETL